MKLFLQILFLLLTWFSNLNATSPFTKTVLPIYERSSSKIKNVKEEVKTDNFLIAWDAFYAAADIVSMLPNGAIKININASTSKSDIDKCVETGNYYNNNSELFSPSVFSYDNMLIKLIDTIRDNDFGVSLSEKEEGEKQLICSELISLVEQLIFVNNRLKVV